MKIAIAALVVLMAVVSEAKGLACGEGAMTPMEARLERSCGNKNAVSTRIGNAKKTSAQLQKSIPNAVEGDDGSKVSCQTVTKPCCRSKQTVKVSCCSKSCCGSKQGCRATVGVGNTAAAAEAAAKAPNAGNKTTW